jgi:anti-sigma B factor antagonist
MTSAPLAVTSGRRPDGVTVLTAVGEIDISNTGVLATALELAPGRVVVDVTGVGYLDSAGLSVLFSHADRMEVVAGALLEPVLTISGLGDITTIRRE